MQVESKTIDKFICTQDELLRLAMDGFKHEQFPGGTPGTAQTVKLDVTTDGRSIVGIFTITTEHQK